MPGGSGVPVSLSAMTRASRESAVPRALAAKQRYRPCRRPARLALMTSVPVPGVTVTPGWSSGTKGWSSRVQRYLRAGGSPSLRGGHGGGHGETGGGHSLDGGVAGGGALEDDIIAGEDDELLRGLLRQFGGLQDCGEGGGGVSRWDPQGQPRYPQDSPRTTRDPIRPSGTLPRPFPRPMETLRGPKGAPKDTWGPQTPQQTPLAPP